MGEQQDQGFYARLLGGFALSYNGKPLFINANPQCKYMQILLILLKAGKGGVERKDLLDIIRPEDHNAEKRPNNFRQQVFTLRKVLAASGLPEGRYIVSKQYRYYFTRDYEVGNDTEVLDGIIGQIKEEKKKTPPRGSARREDTLTNLYMEYCQAYTGEFLPMLSGEEWATQESAYYQKWYTESLKKLSSTLKEEGRYEALLKLSTAASQMYPYDEWQAVQIECLMAMDRKKEAVKVYEEAAGLFYQDLGTEAMDQAMARCRGDGGNVSYMASTLAGIKKRLREEGEPKGPYPCSYPSFLDTYHIIMRLEERGLAESTLLVCTLPGAGGESTGEEEQEERMEALRRFLERELRTGDVYTKYSRNQYLALLTGAGQGKGEEAAGRLKARWAEEGGPPGETLELAVCRAAQEKSKERRDGEEENVCGTYRQPGKRHLAGPGHMAG